MTPEQKEAHELKQELEALRHEKKQQAETAEQAELQKQTTYYEERYNKEYEEAIGIANLPKCHFTEKDISSISQALTGAEKMGFELPEEFGPKDILRTTAPK